MIGTIALFLQLTVAPHVVVAPLQKKCELRDTTTNYIVIHYDSAANYTWLRKYLRRRRLSYNYYIERDGTIVQLVRPECKANHAGLSYWDGHFMMNRYSIGICLQNIPPAEFTEKQYRSLVWLYFRLGMRWGDVYLHRPVGHSDVAIPRGRKDDPGPKFNWQHVDSLIADSLQLHIEHR